MTAGIFDGYKRVFDDVMDERARQEALHPGDTCWELGKDAREKWRVLHSEVWEVFTAIAEDEPPANLRAELIQVAAVAVAWVQALDRAEEAKS